MRRAGLLSLALTAACGGALEEPPVVALPPPPPGGASLQVAVDPGSACEAGDIVRAGKRSYCIQKKATSFQESERWCAANGGHLATIGSEEENRALQRALGPAVTFDRNAWIGLYQTPSGEWRWSAGEPVTATRWYPGEPNNAGNNEHCGELYAGVAQWNDNVCEGGRPFLCEKRSGPAKCGGQAFAVGSIWYCFERDTIVSWGDADRSCKARGGALASFTSAQELEAFTAAISSRLGVDRAWIGFTDEGHEGRWTTVTGQEPRFTSWRPGEPNNAGGNENCAEWYVADAGWNDIPCGDPHVGICALR